MYETFHKLTLNTPQDFLNVSFKNNNPAMKSHQGVFSQVTLTDYYYYYYECPFILLPIILKKIFLKILAGLRSGVF